MWKTAALLIFLRALYEAIRLRWLSDDAFISFRYALNFSRGQGLVFNPGEYVEGFTNLLWTLLMAPALAMGLDAGSFSMALSIASMLVTLGFFLYRGWKQGLPSGSNGEKGANSIMGKAPPPSLADSAKRWNPDPPGSPEKQVWILAFFLLAGIHHFHVFATSGLETMAFSCCLSLGTLLLLEGRRLAGPGLLSLGCLLRPDGLLLLAFAYGLLLWLSVKDRWRNKHRPSAMALAVRGRAGEATAEPFSPGHSWRHSLLLLLPLVPLLLSEIWRLYYYGDFLPNTFYAKSAYSPYPNQGLYYIYVFYRAYWFLPLLLLFGIALLFFLPRMPRNWFPLLFAIVLWHAYVIWVGGDFMFARFLVPILPLLCYLIALPLAHYFSAPSGRGLIGNSYLWIALLMIVLPFFRIDEYRNLKQQGKEPAIQGIVEERYYYPPRKMAELADVARSYRKIVRTSGMRLAFHGGAAFLIYYMDPSYALESSTGLTDRTLARKILPQRGRIGHEKEATLKYMKERNVHIYMWPPVPGNRNRQIDFSGFWAPWQIVEYDPEVFGALQKDPRIQFSFRPHGLP